MNDHPSPASPCPKHQSLARAQRSVFHCVKQIATPLSLAQDPNISHMWAWLAIVHKMYEQINK